MKNQHRSILLLTLALLTISAYSTSLRAFADNDDENEQTIALKELPQVIQDALKGVEVEEVEKETKDGKTVYEVEIEADDVEIELTLSASGQLLGVEIEHEDDSDENGN
ncbi:MAG: hypothetical protein KDA86_13440 [Planctomycetaceae bacterium]|nr:hypothetical protein [Planctomycetaceae bacterium]